MQYNKCCDGCLGEKCDCRQFTTRGEPVAYSPEVVQIRKVLAKHLNEWSNEMLRELADLLTQKDKETALVVEKERERIENALERINELTDESCRNGLNICPKCASLELVRRKLTPQ